MWQELPHCYKLDSIRWLKYFKYQLVGPILIDEYDRYHLGFFVVNYRNRTYRWLVGKNVIARG